MSLEPSRVTEIYVPGREAAQTAEGSVGSGYLVTPRLVLTAKHVVQAAVPTSLEPAPDEHLTAERLAALTADNPRCRIRPLDRDQTSFRDASVVWTHRELDVALIAVLGADWPVRPELSTSWTDITGFEATRCTAVGFPVVDQVPGRRVRESRQVFGEIPPLSQFKTQRWAIAVLHGIGTTAPPGHHLYPPESSWAGMSGAAVFVDDELVGVIESDVDAGDRTRLELRALPARTFASDPDLVAWLSADSGPRAWTRSSPHGHTTSPRSASGVFLDVSVPAARTLVGRTGLLTDVRRRLVAGEDTALLSGLPGAGKTALAVNAARDDTVLGRFSDGRLWLPVGRQSTTGLSHWVHRMTSWAQQLGVRADERAEAQSAEDGPRMAQLVSEALGERRALLVFDDVWSREDALLFKDIGTNCVHLLTTRIPKVAALFADQATVVDQLDRRASLELVEHHCRGAHQMFGEDLEAVLTVVDGLPLTLVLVGVKLRQEVAELGSDAGREFLHDVLSAEERLQLPLDLPQQDLPLVGSRHRTLQAVIGLTTEGLEPDELDALRALTAFPPKANTFSREAARHVAGGRRHVDVLRSNGLLELVDVQGRRMTMHQAIADFARRGQEGDDDAFGRMAEYFVDYVGREVQGSPSDSWVDTLDAESENIRAALEWTIRRGHSHLGLRMMAALWPYWYERSLFARGRDLADRILAIPPTQDADEVEYRILRAKVLNDAGNFAYNMADLSGAEKLHTEALAIRTSLGEEALTAGSKNNLGLVLRERGDHEAARASFEEALEINERTRHTQWRLWRGMNLNNLGILDYRLGRFVDARDRQCESVAQFDEMGHAWGRAMARLDLAQCLIALGDPDVPGMLAALLEERWAVRDDKAVATALRALGDLALRNAAPAAASRLFLAALQLSAPLSDRLGEGIALQGLVLASHAVEDCRLGGRASGALRGYQEISGVVPPPWQVRRLTDAQQDLRRVDPAGYDREAAAGRQVATAGMSHLRDALGSAVPDLRPEDEVRRFLGRPAT
ncbi:NB-ARC domain-containing protein [Geodermatophilus amargosae]|uniref:NB-ARC domain-containing protein n=1 Tax=Geodermatophilus amargosae TaxID=1296565 RepID=UPI0034E0126A